MGTEGMKASLVSREVIADSIELVVRGHVFDGVVALSGCDKTIPGTVMALARLDVPGADALRRVDRARTLQGPRRHDPGRVRGGRRARGGQMSESDLAELEASACPGAGACGGQFTANTMAMAIEMLGISPIGRERSAGQEPAKAEVGRECRSDGRWTCCGAASARATMITRAAIENAIAAIAAAAARPTRVLHLLALAREAGVALDIDDFDAIAARTPILADLKPGGRFVAVDMYRAGGVRCSRSGWPRRGCCTTTPDRHRPDDRRDRRRAARRPGRR